VLKREPLIKMDVELERFDATIKEEMNHPEIATIGLGDVDDARLKRSIDILVDANQLPRTPGDLRGLHARIPATEGGPPDQADRPEDELTPPRRARGWVRSRAGSFIAKLGKQSTWTWD